MRNGYPVAASPCRIWDGNPEHYQRTVQRELASEGRLTTPHLWATPTCDTANCLEHVTIHAPRAIAYPRGVCVYCGNIAGTLDHLLPRAWSGEANRRFVAVVPACGECNNAISDRGSYRISDRRALAHENIAKRHRKALRTPAYTQRQLSEYGPTMRAYIKHALGEQAQTRARLAWPVDPDYDIRAFQHSGIDDPLALGLL